MKRVFIAGKGRNELGDRADTSGEAAAQSWSKSRVSRVAKERGLDSTSAMSAAIQAGSTSDIPTGSSLATWLTRAGQALRG